MRIESFEDLRIFQLAREICQIIWEFTRRPEVAQDKGIVYQMLNSSGSMMDNPAEGFGRGSNNEFKSFLAYGIASGNELASQLIRLSDRKCITKTELVETRAKITSYCKQSSTLMGTLKDSGFRGQDSNS